MAAGYADLREKWGRVHMLKNVDLTPIFGGAIPHRRELQGRRAADGQMRTRRLKVKLLLQARRFSLSRSCVDRRKNFLFARVACELQFAQSRKFFSNADRTIFNRDEKAEPVTRQSDLHRVEFSS